MGRLTARLLKRGKLLQFLLVVTMFGRVEYVLSDDSGKPSWVERGSGAFVVAGQKIFYGVGVVEGIKNANMAQKTAENRARAELAKVSESYSAYLMRRWDQVLSEYGQFSLRRGLEEAIQTAFTQAIADAKIVDRWQANEDDGSVWGTIKKSPVYVLTGFSLDDVQRYAAKEFNRLLLFSSENREGAKGLGKQWDKAFSELLKVDAAHRLTGESHVGEGEFTTPASPQSSSALRAQTSAITPVGSEVDSPPGVRVKAAGSFWALIVGIEHYPSLPAVDFAQQDVTAIKQYLTTTMGFPEENVVMLTDSNATKSGIQKYLNEWLPRNTNAKSRILIFFAGHGAPETETGDAYLVPYDGDPNFLKTTGILLKDFYTAIEALPAKDVIVLTDACFSGAGGRSVLAKGARPLVTKVDTALPPSSKILSIAAASGSEITASYEEKGHGLFTYFLLKGLRGDADKDQDGWVTVAEAYDYLKPNVQKMARRQNREQTPQLLPGLDALGVKAKLKLAKVK
ncbi:MAG: caspase family protein [Nitrospirae bacterium]|nr:caspase family protein [Nitrospirota bacterium]